MRPFPRGVGAALAALTLLLVACAGSGEPPADAGDGGTSPDGVAPAGEISGELLVAAAASLTDAFTELGQAFEAAHPDLTVTFAFAGSSTLASQIVEGAPFDVFASASPRQVALVIDAGLAERSEVVATNVLELAVEAGNPLGIRALEDLERDDVVVVLAAPEVPAGELAAGLLQRTGLSVTPSSLEVDVRAALGRVELGEADVAIVYRSDVVTASDAVEGVALAGADDLATDYPIVVLRDATNPDAAAAWVAFVTGPAGRDALERAGLRVP